MILLEGKGQRTQLYPNGYFACIMAMHMASEGRQGGEVKVARDVEDGNVAIVTLANERIANALDVGMLARIEMLQDELADARATVIVGAGARHFCSGADIKAWGPMTPEQFADEWIERGMNALDGIRRLPGLVVAAVNGTCFGGGLELALRADVRYAAAHARFAFPETGIGTIPGWGGGPLMSAEAGNALAAEMIMGGRILTAAEAMEAGIVSRVCEAAQLMDAALEIARAAAQRSPVANAAAKRILYAKIAEATAEHMRESAQCKQSPDGAEGLAAFAAKRSPRY